MPPRSRRHRRASIAKHRQDLLSSLKFIESGDEFARLFADLCTDQELQHIAERWAIAKLLHMGFSYRTIARKTGAGTATISRIARRLSRSDGCLLMICRRRELHMMRLHGEHAIAKVPGILSTAPIPTFGSVFTH